MRVSKDKTSLINTKPAIVTPGWDYINDLIRRTAEHVGVPEYVMRQIIYAEIEARNIFPDGSLQQRIKDICDFWLGLNDGVTSNRPPDPNTPSWNDGCEIWHPDGLLTGCHPSLEWNPGSSDSNLGWLVLLEGIKDAISRAIQFARTQIISDSYARPRLAKWFADNTVGHVATIVGTDIVLGAVYALAFDKCILTSVGRGPFQSFMTPFTIFLIPKLKPIKPLIKFGYGLLFDFLASNGRNRTIYDLVANDISDLIADRLQRYGTNQERLTSMRSFRSAVVASKNAIPYTDHVGRRAAEFTIIQIDVVIAHLLNEIMREQGHQIS